MTVRRRGWRYFATRLNGDGTETLLDLDLPLEDVQIEDVLSGDNAITGKLDPANPRLFGADGKPILKEWAHAIYAENDGDIRCGGILTLSEFSGPEWSIEATGFTGYGRDMPYTAAGYKGIEVDPIDVARLIWTHIQGQPMGNLGLTFANTTTGGKVKIGTELKQVEFDTKSGPVSFESGPYKLNFYTNHDLMGDFDDLAEITPFDYHERHWWKADGTIGHKVDIGYPKIGKRRNDLRFINGVNIFEPPMLSRDGSIYASGTMVLGAGDGPSMIHSVQDKSATSDRLRRIAVVVDDRIKTKKKAQTRAQAENQWRARLDNVESLIVRDHPMAPLGSVSVGDEIRIESRGDWVTVDMQVRVLGISISPEDGNTAEYTVARTDMLTT